MRLVHGDYKFRFIDITFFSLESMSYDSMFGIFSKYIIGDNIRSIKYIKR